MRSENILQTAPAPHQAYKPEKSEMKSKVIHTSICSAGGGVQFDTEIAHGKFKEKCIVVRRSTNIVAHIAQLIAVFSSLPSFRTLRSSHSPFQALSN